MRTPRNPWSRRPRRVVAWRLVSSVHFALAGLTTGHVRGSAQRGAIGRGGAARSRNGGGKSAYSERAVGDMDDRHRRGTDRKVTLAGTSARGEGLRGWEGGKSVSYSVRFSDIPGRKWIAKGLIALRQPSLAFTEQDQ